MGNPKRGRNSRGGWRKMTADDKMRRGTKRLGRAERKMSLGELGGHFPEPGFVSRAIFGDHRRW